MVIAYKRSTPPVEMINHRHAWRTGPAELTVIGRDGLAHYANDTSTGIPRCPCPRGSRGLSCYHAAVALRRMQREGAA